LIIYFEGNVIVKVNQVMCKFFNCLMQLKSSSDFLQILFICLHCYWIQFNNDFSMFFMMMLWILKH